MSGRRLRELVLIVVGGVGVVGGIATAEPAVVGAGVTLLGLPAMLRHDHRRHARTLGAVARAAAPTFEATIDAGVDAVGSFRERDRQRQQALLGARAEDDIRKLTTAYVNGWLELDEFEAAVGRIVAREERRAERELELL